MSANLGAWFVGMGVNVAPEIKFKGVGLNEIHYNITTETNSTAIIVSITHGILAFVDGV